MTRKMTTMVGYITRRDFCKTSNALSMAAPHRVVVPDDFCRRPDHFDLAAIQQNGVLAQVCDHAEAVGHKQHGPAAARHVVHFAETLLLKTGVADCKDFVNDEDFRVEVGGD